MTAAASAAAERSGRRLRVLMLSEACNPEWPSLPIVAYNQTRALAEHADVVVATQIRNKPVLDRWGVGKAEVVYLDTEYVASPFFKLSKLIRRSEQYAQTAAVAMAWPAQVAFDPWSLEKCSSQPVCPGSEPRPCATRCELTRPLATSTR